MFSSNFSPVETLYSWLSAAKIDEKIEYAEQLQDWINADIGKCHVIMGDNVEAEILSAHPNFLVVNLLRSSLLPIKCFRDEVKRFCRK
jgi:hypothetical protein